jgi:hypothetical protein
VEKRKYEKKGGYFIVSSFVLYFSRSVVLHYKKLPISNATPQMNLRDQNGNTITGPAMGLEKKIEHWSKPNRDTPWLIGPSPFTQSSSIQQVITLFNQYAPPTGSDPRPLLECLSSGTGNLGPFIGMNQMNKKNVNVVYACLGAGGIILSIQHDPCDLLTGSLGNNSGINLFFNSLASLDPTYNPSVAESDSFSVSNYNQFLLERIDQDEELMVWSAQEIFRNEINYPEVELNDGIYRFSVLTNDGQYLPIHFEFVNIEEKPLNLKTKNFFLSENVNITLFPVPVKKEKITLKIESQLTTSIKYTIKDLNGKLLYSTKFEINSLENIETELNLNNLSNINDLLIHIFEFPDGSKKVLKTL